MTHHFYIEKRVVMQENKVFETETVIVYHNGNGEIFIKNKSSNRILQIGDVGSELKITCHNGLLALTSSVAVITLPRSN
jgi:hypothetical protein